MKTDFKLIGSVLVISIEGKYDITQVTLFETSLKEQMSVKPKAVALSLEKLTYIDSSGIGSLVRAMHICRKREADFYCTNLTEEITGIFTLAKLNDYIPILPFDEILKKYS